MAALAFADVVAMAQALGDDVVTHIGQGNNEHVSVLVDGKPKGIAWLWAERVDPKKPRVLNPRVLVVRVRDVVEKELLLAGDPAVYFTEPHYDGAGAVLVRLDVVTKAELRRLLAAARDRHRAGAPGRPRKKKAAAAKKKKSAKRA